MSNENFRRELNNVFDDVSGSPSANLRDRVRSAVAEAPEPRGPYMVAAVAAVVITALIVGVLFVANPLRRPTGQVLVPIQTPSPSASTPASPQTSPSASPSPAATPLPPFICSADTLTSTQPALPTAYVANLRTGRQNGYDRLVIDLSNGEAASIEVTPQNSTTFGGSPSGAPVKTRGTAGIKVLIRGADMHTSYTGSRDIVTGYSTLVEVRQIEDFEGVVQLALGVNGQPCYRAFYLSSPTRLVVDVRAAS